MREETTARLQPCLVHSVSASLFWCCFELCSRVLDETKRRPEKTKHIWTFIQRCIKLMLQIKYKKRTSSQLEENLFREWGSSHYLIGIFSICVSRWTNAITQSLHSATPPTLTRLGSYCAVSSVDLKKNV